jgi:large subunit ribosomal protein L28
MATTAIGVGVGGVLLGNSICFRKTRQLSISKTSLVSVSEIGFVTSQLSGIRISYNPPKPLSAPFSPALQPVIARKLSSLSLVFVCSRLFNKSFDLFSIS